MKEVLPMATMPVGEGFFVTSGFGPRWGTVHWGTDFGRGGGSGGHPVYAVKDGTVTHSGAASGFGQWVVLDHHANVGGGTSVYGHIIPEVAVGAFVREGQRIARINPDSNTNGGVAPHLHMEWHRYAWAPPGPNRLDPMQTVLKGAKWPGTAAKSTTPKNTRPLLYGVDVSEHQDGMSLRRAKDEGFDFAILRLCDGTYRDKVFRSHLADAEGAGLLVSTYWYLRAPSEGTTIAQQVDVIDQQMGGRRDLGVWIDVESVDSAGRKLLAEADVWAAKRELERRGYHVPGIYSGAWYWEKMPGGEPSMKGLGHLWVSNYGRNRRGPASTTYHADGGDSHPGWSYPLGDRKPDILQFGSNGEVAGHFPVDVNAYRGSRAELQAIFTGKKTNIKKEGLTLTSIDQNRITWSLDQLAGPGKNKDGEPTFSGWDLNSVLTAANKKIDGGKGVTLFELLALTYDRQNKLEEKVSAQENALNQITESFTQLISAVATLNSTVSTLADKEPTNE